MRKCRTGKYCFPSEEAVKDALLGARIKRELFKYQKRKEVNYYDCPLCPWWHLTSQPFDPERSNKQRGT